jgi:hypothetical protein
LHKQGDGTRPELRSSYYLDCGLSGLQKSDPQFVAPHGVNDGIVVSWGSRKLVKIEHFLGGERRYSANSQ